MKLATTGEAYRLYKAWCKSLGIQPADFITWAHTTQLINPPVDSTRYINTSVLREAE